MNKIDDNYDLKYLESKLGKQAECMFTNGQKKQHYSGLVCKVKNTLSLHIEEAFYDWYIILYNYDKNEFNPNLYDIT